MASPGLDACRFKYICEEYSYLGTWGLLLQTPLQTQRQNSFAAGIVFLGAIEAMCHRILMSATIN
jgi:hypothetical protein